MSNVQTRCVALALILKHAKTMFVLIHSVLLQLNVKLTSALIVSIQNAFLLVLEHKYVKTTLVLNFSVLLQLIVKLKNVLTV